MLESSTRDLGSHVLVRRASMYGYVIILPNYVMEQFHEAVLSSYSLVTYGVSKHKSAELLKYVDVMANRDQETYTEVVYQHKAKDSALQLHMMRAVDLRPCKYSINKFRGKLGNECLTTVSFRSRIGEALQPFPG